METLVHGLIGLLWLAIGCAMLWALVGALRQLVNEERELPFFAMLGWQGLKPERIQDELGTEELARAVRRCAFCRGKSECRERLRANAQAYRSIDCPNRGVFARALER